MAYSKLISVVLGIVCALGAAAESPGYYSPQLGRFLQRDVLGYVDGLSLYHYAQSSPQVLTDPMGGCSDKEKPFVPGIRVTTPAEVTEECGGALYGVGWDIPPGYQNGNIVQKVRRITKVYNCSDELIVDTDTELYERWAFSWDKEHNQYEVITGGVKSWNEDDTYITSSQCMNPVAPGHKAEPAKCCTKGSVNILGEVKGVANYDPPGFVTGCDPTAKNIDCTKTKPPHWDDFSGFAPHNMTVTWDCCQGETVDTTSVTSTP